MSARRLLRWGSLAAAGALVVLALAGTWLLTSAGGRDWALARLQARLPSGATLRIDAVAGTLLGPLDARGVHYRDSQQQIDIAHLRLEHGLAALLHGRWRVQRLWLEGVDVRYTPGPAPAAPKGWPDVLPRWSLPLTIDVADLRVHTLSVSRDGAPVITLARVDGAFALGDGELALDRLRVVAATGEATLAGTYRPRDRFRSDLRLDAQWRPGADGAPVPVHAQLQGDLRAATLTAASDGAAPLRLQASLRDGEAAAPTWRIALDSPGVDTSTLGFTAAHAIAGTLSLDGRGGEARLAARGAVDMHTFDIPSSALRVEADAVQLTAVTLRTAEGALVLDGRVAWGGAAPAGDLRLHSAGWRLPAQAGGVDAVVAGAVHARGALDAWQLDGDLQFRRAQAQATLALAARGDRARAELTRVAATTPAGHLQAQGTLAWAPRGHVVGTVRAQGFDPGFFLPDYPGALDGVLSVDASRDARRGWIGRLALDDLRGRWRGRAVAGKAHAHWDGERGDGAAQLQVGRSRVQATGRAGAMLDLRAQLAPLDLADLLADAHGELRGELAITGPRDAPAYRANLQGRQLAWQGVSARVLTLDGVLPTTGRSEHSRLDLQELAIDGRALGHARLELDGTRRDLRAALTLDGEFGRADATLQGGQAGADWQGQLAQLRLAPALGPAWSLRAPADARWRDTRGLQAAGCLVAAAPGGEVCARYDARTATLQLHALPFALLQPWLARQSRDLQAAGVIDGEARLQRGARGWEGQARLRAPQLDLRLHSATRSRSLLGLQDLRVELALAADQLQARVAAGLPAQGRLQGEARVALASAGALSGQLSLDLRDLAWLELFSVDLAQPRGALDGELTLGGTLAAPRWSGHAALSGFAADLPALNVPLREGALRVDGDATGRLQVRGNVRAGQGRLEVAGDFVPGRAPAPLQLTLRGDDATAADTPDLQAVLAPDLQLSYGAGVLQLRGRVQVARAQVNLERLDTGISTSADVVVLDPAPGTTTNGLVVDSDVDVRLGDDVRLRGFGLDGRLGGGLRLRDRPGRAATATGSLQVRGTYSAYGRKLEIVRGRLDYSDDGFDDPALDLLAQREIGEVTVGVRVRGRALAPETSIESTPAMETTEALSWLVFGRPLASTTGAESQSLSASALALGAGSDLLAQQIGTRLGLDEAGVVDSRALGGAALTVGKQISPRLFVSYGVSLLGTGQVVTLKYLLRHGLDATLESGTETSAALRWRKEK